MQTGLVIAEYKSHYDVLVNKQVYNASVRGHFHQEDGSVFPKVGDMVSLELLTPDQAVIETIKPRRNQLARWNERAGEAQVMVTNVDYLLVVMGLDNDFSVARLQRYLGLASQSGVKPVIVLNKADIAPDLDAAIAAVGAVAGDAPVHVVAAEAGEGLDVLRPYVSDDVTAVLLGSSGVGKSTIINQLVGEAVQPTRSVRGRDDRGRHTTTHRQLFMTATGGRIIDTPGMRELALVDDQAAAADQFADIDALTMQCQFRNCDHDKTTGCAILAAIEAGTLDEVRAKQYFKLARSEERLRRRR